MTTAYLLPLIAPIALLLTAVLCVRSEKWWSQLAEGAAFFALLVAVTSFGVLIWMGPGASPYLILPTRLDLLSAIMLMLVSFVGWIVLRYAATYLDGEPRQGPFTAWMCATLASVLMLVQSDHLIQLGAAWIATSFFLQKLLLFYADRTGAQRAARKKFVVSRLSDIAVIAAFFLLAIGYGTGNISEIISAAKTGNAPQTVVWAVGFLAIAALLKSAQFPTHGWLTEVMETPTPVSALLHAGVINAGGFLLLRFADVLVLAPWVMAFLVMIGGFTALFGGIVMLTQSAVKTSLAWSTIAQMGFMIMQCGLALFPLALLHIVAHSLYKAHAFLSSGGAVRIVTDLHRPGPIAVPNVWAVTKAFAIAIAIYALLAVPFGFADKSAQTIALGAILIFGVAYLLAQGMAGAAPYRLMRKTVMYSLAAALGYFTLQTGAEWAMAETFPATPQPGALEWTMIVLAVGSFGLIAVAQAMLPLWAHKPWARHLRIHATNGFYVTAAFDRLVWAWSLRKSV
ncbi:proton-conducting transporter membrane subunit [Parasulfitobacter algicola]|uniref:Probable inorganic carbon transporter subunit DabB n=1 Tax=Parasulfitobacter algicola TaxID=2614809 RepID=A0ABX2IME3_9RHOB|nr:proton-conducting transporter membrane subunit [Sulfitobacter algicola]NSX54048.1 oxidoreductase [Sulfitobacter algicola]